MDLGVSQNGGSFVSCAPARSRVKRQHENHAHVKHLARRPLHFPDLPQPSYLEKLSRENNSSSSLLILALAWAGVSLKDLKLTLKKQQPNPPKAKTVHQGRITI